MATERRRFNTYVKCYQAPNLSYGKLLELDSADLQDPLAIGFLDRTQPHNRRTLPAAAKQLKLLFLSSTEIRLPPVDEHTHKQQNEYKSK
jgi:hypothetical protein